MRIIAELAPAYAMENIQKSLSLGNRALNKPRLIKLAVVSNWPLEYTGSTP
jgi:hypothetical protein